MFFPVQRPSGALKQLLSFRHRRAGSVSGRAHPTQPKDLASPFIFGHLEVQTNTWRWFDPFSKSVSSAFTRACDLERLGVYVHCMRAEAAAAVLERAYDSDLPNWAPATEESGHEPFTRLEVRATGASQESRVCPACHPYGRLRNRSKHHNLQLDQRNAVESSSRTRQGERSGIAHLEQTG